MRATQTNSLLMPEVSCPIHAFDFDEAYNIFKYRIFMCTGWQLETPATEHHVRVKTLFKSPKVNSFSNLEELECTISELRRESAEKEEEFLKGKVFEYEKKNFSVTFIYKGLRNIVTNGLANTRNHSSRTYAF